MELRQLGRYELLGELGKGAMGVVYRAIDPVLQRTVAIKTIPVYLDPSEQAEYEARFYHEAKAAGRLSHPNIVTIYDVGKSGDTTYMAMELLEGQDLKSLLAPKKPLPIPQALDIAAQVADGLAYAHEHEVVHRDVKPANLMITRSGLVKIMDFGIARMRASEIRTQTGVLLGSPSYLSPEQVLGKRADHRSDIFSLGIVLYEMLTGERPFTGAEITAIMYQIVHLSPRAPSVLNPEVPEILNFVVAKALAKSPEDRYQDAREFATDLRECRKHVESQVQPKISIDLDAFPKHSANRLADGGTGAIVGSNFPAGRKMDAAPEPAVPPETPVALGISTHFDSFDATLRLVTATGAAEQFGEYIKTQKIARAGTPAARSAPPPKRITPPTGTAADKPAAPVQRAEAARNSPLSRKALVVGLALAIALAVALVAVLS
ncbi:serine/threonine-protein kinase [Pelomicrobium sp. G1]|uniref:serine/threonine-protein kinase n=1 Tax=unclassified Pelomicrobium TaxID=2815318 RepID=UPI003F76578A